MHPLFGAFKHGDPLHYSYNKTIGGHGRSSELEYQEEMEQDHVKYMKNVKRPIWRDPTNGKTMMNSTVRNNFKNINKEKAEIFGR